MLGVMKVSELKEMLDEFEGNEEIYLLFEDTQTNRIVQLFINPYVLNNSGFLLSFLAVIGVTFVAPRLQEILGAKSKTAKSLCISLSASVTTLPVLLWNYGTYPWYSVFLNLLIPLFYLLIIYFELFLLYNVKVSYGN